MKGNHSAALRALYIILVPIVLLIILLNSGWLQRLLPAASVHGESFSVVRYNFYYFDYYNSFLEENEDRLDELGYDPQQADSEQSYDGTITWRDFFLAQADAALAETAYFCDLAEAAGYEFSQEELSPVAARLAENEALYTQYGISAGNYYISYYGAGMTEERYAQELTRKVQAQAYKAHLIGTYEADQAAVEDWLGSYSGGTYNAVDLRVITLAALPDRGTGETGPEQLAALESKLDKLTARYGEGYAFEELQAAFSTRALGDQNGVLTGATASSLPGVLAAWCLTDQDALTPGDTFSCIDRESGIAYFAVLDGVGASGPQADAVYALGVQAVEEELARAIAGDYAVSANSIGMLLAAA